MRKLASIQTVKAIAPIEGADKIETATILGWSCVVLKGKYKVGDLCVYCEVDSLIPRTEWSEFLFKGDDKKKDTFRLKTIRLRGQVSQGLVLPIDVIPTSPQEDGKPFYQYGMYQEGIDVTEILGIEKYEPPIPAQLQGQVRGMRPSFIPKTDETRIQAEPQVLERHKGKRFYITEKIDGSSMTAYINDGEFGVCSRKIDLKETEENTFWKVARALDLEGKLRKLNRNLAIQGELHGEGIQGNKYKLKGQDFRAFNIYDIDKAQFLSFHDFKTLCEHLGVCTVPKVNEITLNHTVEELVEMSKDMSRLNPKTKREGIVLRPIVEERDSDLGRLSFKVINPEFLLKYGE